MKQLKQRKTSGEKQEEVRVNNASYFLGYGDGWADACATFIIERVKKTAKRKTAKGEK